MLVLWMYFFPLLIYVQLVLLRTGEGDAKAECERPKGREQALILDTISLVQFSVYWRLQGVNEKE